jgi:hypothetical protein
MKRRLIETIDIEPFFRLNGYFPLENPDFEFNAVIEALIDEGVLSIQVLETLVAEHGLKTSQALQRYVMELSSISTGAYISRILELLEFIEGLLGKDGEYKISASSIVISLKKTLEIDKQTASQELPAATTPSQYHS